MLRARIRECGEGLHKGTSGGCDSTNGVRQSTSPANLEESTEVGAEVEVALLVHEDSLLTLESLLGTIEVFSKVDVECVVSNQE